MHGNKVKVVAVTKTKPFKNIIEIYQLGITSIGENRVNDAIKKFESLKNMPNVEKRFIGHLQSNKTKKCVSAFDTIDSIHSLKLLKKVSKECEKAEKKIKVLLEINTSREKQKKGFLLGCIILRPMILCHQILLIETLLKISFGTVKQ